LQEDGMGVCINSCKCEVAAAINRMNVMKSMRAVGLLTLLGISVQSTALANIKDEFERAKACDYYNAEFLSDVGVFDDAKVRFCISADRKELIYVMAMGTSWVVPFDRQYRANGIPSLYTLEGNRLVLYQKENGVVKRKLLGRKR